jgi:hypothetical protein
VLPDQEKFKDLLSRLRAEPGNVGSHISLSIAFLYPLTFSSYISFILMISIEYYYARRCTFSL